MSSIVYTKEQMLGMMIVDSRYEKVWPELVPEITPRMRRQVLRKIANKPRISIEKIASERRH